LTTPVKQVLSVSFTTTSKGVIWVRVNLSKASTTVYFDPKPLSTSSRTWMAGSGLFVNEGTAAGGSAVFPAAGNVVANSGVFGPNGNDYTPTYVAADPHFVITSNGNYGNPGSQLTPLATLPVATKVLTTQANYGVSGALTTPTYVPVATTDVASGVTFGPSSSLTGTYSSGSGLTLTQLQTELASQTTTLEGNLTTQLATQTTTLGTNLGTTLDARKLTVAVPGQNYIYTDQIE
jgi:hypothetical protein